MTFDFASATISRQTELIKLCQNVYWLAYVRLSDIATITRGGNFQKRYFLEDRMPCIHYGQIFTWYGAYTDRTICYIDKNVAEKSRMAVKNDIVMAVAGENVEDVYKCAA